MPKIFTSFSQKKGENGENIAVKFLMKQGHRIITRNYTRKWGELDIVSEKDGVIHFVEVKSVCKPDLSYVTHETLDQYHPEDNMHPWKLRRLSRTVQTYLLAEHVPDEQEWQVDLLVVFMDMQCQKYIVKVVSDIIL